jgi:hypothetical protein
VVDDPPREIRVSEVERKGQAVPREPRTTYSLGGWDSVLGARKAQRLETLNTVWKESSLPLVLSRQGAVASVFLAFSVFAQAGLARLTIEHPSWTSRLSAARAHACVLRAVAPLHHANDELGFLVELQYDQKRY